MKTNVETGLKTKNNFSENLKWFRKNENLTQHQLAEKLNLKRSIVGGWEEGRANPRLNTLIQLSDFFGVSIDDLVIREPKESIREFNQVN